MKIPRGRVGYIYDLDLMIDNIRTWFMIIICTSGFVWIHCLFYFGVILEGAYPEHIRFCGELGGDISSNGDSRELFGITAEAKVLIVV